MSYDKYYPNGWQSGEAGGTAITPEALDHIEKGVAGALPKDGTDPMAGDLPMGGHKVIGLGTPTADGDAVPLGYADSKFAPAEFGLKEIEGSVLSIQNSGDAPLHSMKLYGKTTQDGTPAPDAPVELVSVGAGGTVGVRVCGKNLLRTAVDSWTSHGITYTKNEDGSFSYSGTSIGNDSYCYFMDLPYYSNTMLLKAGTYVLSAYDEKITVIARKINADETFVNIASGVKTAKFTLTEATNIWIAFFLDDPVSGMAYSGTFYPQLELGSTATDYEPYRNGGTVTAQTPNGLPGIPVTSGGNYTDESGQMWICDEVDFARGKYVQRVNLFKAEAAVGGVLNQSSTAWIGGVAYDTNMLTPASNTQMGIALCSHLPLIKNSEQYVGAKDSGISVTVEKRIYVTISGVTTLEALNNWLKENEVYVAYALAAPIETDLTAEEIAAYAALHTNHPNTTIYNDAGADMNVEYYSPVSAVPVNMGHGRAGHLLLVDEHGCVNTQSMSSMPFAPAGYGFGESIVTKAVSDCDDARLTGLYKVNANSAHSPISVEAFMDVKSYSNNSKVQKIITNGTAVPVYATRIMSGGVWGDWEYINPPLTLGVEYRTTERYLGEPVYKKAVDFGALPNATNKIVSHGISNVGVMLDVKLVGSNNAICWTTRNHVTDLFAGLTTIQVTTISDQSANTVHAILTYTKSTN